MACLQLIAKYEMGDNNFDYEKPRPSVVNIAEMGVEFRRKCTYWLENNGGNNGGGYKVRIYGDGERRTFDSISDFVCEGTIVVNGNHVSIDGASYTQGMSQYPHSEVGV
jgi:hypothetical protein